MAQWRDIPSCSLCGKSLFVRLDQFRELHKRHTAHMRQKNCYDPAPFTGQYEQARQKFKHTLGWASASGYS